MEEKKDYSLLRPFDLAAAKRGEAIFCIADRKDEPGERKFIAGPDLHGYFCVQSPDGWFRFGKACDYRMAPLAWVEGKPVYKGDALYYCGPGQKEMAEAEGPHPAKDCDGFAYKGSICGRGYHAPADCFTWNPPKVKRTGFVCIVKTRKICSTGNLRDVIVRNADIYPTRDAAQAWADTCKDVIAIAPIEWEEPAA